MDTVIRVQIQDKTVCISHSGNTLGKGMDPAISLPVSNRTERALQPLNSSRSIKRKTLISNLLKKCL